MNSARGSYPAQCHVPGYLKWYLHVEQTDNLRWHKRFLQYMQSGGVRRPRWLLKSPLHLFRLAAIFEVYPDARVIVTHRDPVSIVPSITSLLLSAHSFNSASYRKEETAEQQLVMWAELFNRFLAARRDLGREDHFIDLLFEDFVGDQMSVVERIYSQFRWPLDEKSRSRMTKFLREEPKGKHGEHDYSLEDIGLSNSRLSPLYDDYRSFLGQLASRPGHRV